MRAVSHEAYHDRSHPQHADQKGGSPIGDAVTGTAPVRGADVPSTGTLGPRGGIGMTTPWVKIKNSRPWTQERRQAYDDEIAEALAEINAREGTRFASRSEAIAWLTSKTLGQTEAAPDDDRSEES